MRPDSERNPDAERHPDTERDPASAPLPHELLTLFALGEAFERGEGLEAVTRLLPSALAHSDRTPADLGRVRVTLRGEQRESPGFASSPWTLHASIPLEDKPPGTLEIAFRERPSCYGEHGFHLEARKLVELAALLVGRWSEPYPQASALIPKPEWSALLDLLAEIDPNLHKRMLRRLMNHLLHLGVPGLQGMVAHFDPGIYAQRERDSHGANAPLPRRDIGGMERAFTDLNRVARLVLRESELNALIRQWMRQDKLGLMALATEQRDIHLVEITEIVERFCREIRQGDPALSPSDDLNVRVALSRRFLSESLKTIRIAKAHLSIYDFGELLLRVAGPAQGNGRLGGKAAGLILASHILQQKAREHPSLADLRIPRAWYLTSDGIYNFLRTNSLEDLWSIKFADIEEIRHSYPYLEQVFKQSFFSVEMRHQLQLALEDLGDGPLIVRSSSLLEDTEGSAFSGKYRSLFLANTGALEARLDALCDAVAEVYASVFGPDAIQYRAERGLLEFVEEMGVIIQRVVGRRVGPYFFPAVAGVAFSRNEFRWSPRLKREDGLMRLVTGLGTRAVDRVGGDFPALVSPGRPEIRVNTSPDQVLRRSQNMLDVINLETGRFESVPLAEVLSVAGDAFPWMERIFSIHRHGALRRPLIGMADPARDEMIPTFDGLRDHSPFLAQIRDILEVLETALETPVDIEFAHDGEALYLLQCRAQSRLADEGPVPVVPTDLPEDRRLFSANRFVASAHVTGVRYIVYVDPDGYRALERHEDLIAVADAVSQLNALLPHRSFILMGPGRWGSRGDAALGVPVTYSGINHTRMLIEIARRKGNYVPDLSFGTHFFQDLVEARIHYLSLYPDEPGNLFNEDFFRQSPNALTEFLPDAAPLASALRVIDIEHTHPGCELNVIMDGDKDRALGFLVNTARKT